MMLGKQQCVMFNLYEIIINQVAYMYMWKYLSNINI